MMRIFLRLYLLVLLPITLVYLLPINPINYFGGKLLEKHFDHEYSSAYELINNKLGDSPESTWVEQVKQLEQYFPLGLSLNPLKELKLKASDEQRLLSQGFILQRKLYLRLLYRMRDTQLILKVGLNDANREFNLTEQQTRGIRYLANEVIFKDGKPEDNFNKIKPFFKVPVVLKKASDFEADGVIIKSLKERGMYYNKPEFKL